MDLALQYRPRYVKLSPSRHSKQPDGVLPYGYAFCIVDSMILQRLLDAQSQDAVSGGELVEL